MSTGDQSQGDPSQLDTCLATQMAGGDVDPQAAAEWTPGQHLGPYRLKRLLGKGGMGVVWLAEQSEPLQREVAIKLLRIQRGKPMLEAYFEVERQALARLSHTNIAQIHDAGRLADDVLYFAMEYVPGMPLNELHAEKPLSPRQTAELMIEICRGVQYAHQRGLIHRDLKPTNILIVESEGNYTPKIIDFGIAISIDSDYRASRQEKSRAGHGGTPAYMAPEQGRDSQGDIDARADVYALGAILAELLHRDPEAAVDFRTISGDQRCQSLSVELGQSDGAVDDRIRTLARGLHGAPRELVAIAHKALSHEPDQRYDSASALAEDLRAWLESRPVRAMGRSRSYAIRCWVRRHRIAAATASLVLASLLAGMLAALHGLDQAREARQVADERRADAEGLVQFMLGDFAENLRPLGRLDLLDEVSQQALEYLGRQDRDDLPQTILNRIRALKTLGEVQVTRQQFDLAERALSEAEELARPWLERDSILRADFLFEGGNVAFWRGAIAYRQQDLESTQRFWQKYLERAQALNEVAPEDPRAPQELGYAYNNLGTLAEQRGQLEDALEYFQRVAQLRRKLVTAPDDPKVLDLANTLSWTARIQGRLGRPVAGATALEEALGLVTEFRARNDDARALIQEATLRDLLGDGSRWQGDLERARDEWMRSLELQEQVVANDPTRPRRRAALARTAYKLAQNPLAPSAQAERWLARAETIRSEMQQSRSDQDDRFLDLHHCIAAFARTRQPEAQQECLVRIWPKTLEAIHSPDADYMQQHLAAELGLALNQAYPDYVTAAQLAELESILAGNPDDQRISLASLRLRRALIGHLQPGSGALAALDRQIEHLLSE